jgi:hypothetical protein
VPRPPRKRTVLPHPRGGLALQSGFSAGARTRASAHACMHADAARPRAPRAEGALVASRGHRIANKQTNKQPIRSLRVAELSGADKEQPKPSEAVAAWAKRPSDCLTVSTGRRRSHRLERSVWLSEAWAHRARRSRSSAAGPPGSRRRISSTRSATLSPCTSARPRSAACCRSLTAFGRHNIRRPLSAVPQTTGHCVRWAA